MSDRTKKNFKCNDLEDWKTGLEKCEQMRRDGIDIDMTLVLNYAVTKFAEESVEETAQRLDLKRASAPVAHAWRKPYARPVAK